MLINKKISTTFLTLIASVTLSSPVLAYGETATEIITELSTNHKGRIGGTEKEQATADYLDDLFSSFDLQTKQENFTYELNDETFSSQNVVAEKKGTSGKQILIGAHYDTAPSNSTLDRSQLQGTNDNSSGVGLLVELAEAIKNIDTIHTIKFIAFGAEEVGLIGSEYYANNMTSQEIKDTLFMANFDSIVFGDQMYLHAGTPAATKPFQGWVRDLALDIAADLDIEVLTNPGLNPDYPKGTGCCSDQVSFQDKMPILVAEATNWFIGDLDGYEQTSDPRVPGGATWHDPVYDSLEFINDNFPDWIEERTSNYSEIMQTLLTEVNQPTFAVPEPTTMVGSTIAMAGLGLLIKRKNRLRVKN